MGTKIENKGNIGNVNMTRKGDININKDNGNNKPNSVWGNGLFFLITILILGGGIYFISTKIISVPLFLLLLVGLILLFTVVGAFVLRASGNTTEQNFFNLMKLAFSKIPVLGLFLKKKNDEQTGLK